MNLPLKVSRPNILRLAGRVAVQKLIWGLLALFPITFAQAQTGSYERTFPQSKADVEKVVKKMQADLAGRLPALEGFAQPGPHPLDRYEQGYYQASVQVSAAATGGSLVRISAKLTAWYRDPSSAHSGYQLLSSNGRLEADFLDRLAEQLAGVSAPNGNNDAGVPETKPAPKASPELPSTPEPETRFKLPDAEPTLSSSLSSSLRQGLPSSDHANDAPPAQPSSGKSPNALQAEAESLEEILKNQAHPKNLVAVKKSGTPVVATPSLNAKPEFFASQHDEFELLNFDADWVHVRISGLSRGWIWRNSVEMPDGMADSDVPAKSSQTPVADLFLVNREETASFPGDWEPLRSKNVKIITVQKAGDDTQNAGPRERLDFAKFLLEKNYREIAAKPQELAGIVIIFDSADGGMIAATMPALQQWSAGTLTDSGLWHKCFFDPPETFDPAPASRKP